MGLNTHILVPREGEDKLQPQIALIYKRGFPTKDAISAVNFF